MKIYKATLKRDNVEVEYTIKAEDKDTAIEKLYKICGQRNLKIKEL